MIRMFLVFVVLSVLISSGLYAWNALTGKEKWEFTKILFRGIIVSLVSVILLSFFYIVL